MTAGNKDWTAGAMLVLAVLFFAASISYVLINNAQQRQERSRIFCEYVYQEKQYQRQDAIRGYKDLPKYARFFNDPVGDLQKVAKQNLIRDFKAGRYSFKRLPPYCPQHDYPASLPQL